MAETTTNPHCVRCGMRRIRKNPPFSSYFDNVALLLLRHYIVCCRKKQRETTLLGSLSVVIGGWVAGFVGGWLVGGQL
jgi:hypothetical protein